MQISDERKAILREVSKTAFGQSHRLELMLEIAENEDGIFTMTDLSRSLDVTMSSLQKPFHDMAAIGLVSALPHGDSRFRHFTRNPSPAWDWAYELAGCSRAAPPGSWRADVAKIVPAT